MVKCEMYTGIYYSVDEKIAKVEKDIKDKGECERATNRKRWRVWKGQREELPDLRKYDKSREKTVREKGVFKGTQA